MLLSDKQIIIEVERHELIDPFIPYKMKNGLSWGLEPSGYTLTLDNIFKVAHNFNVDTLIDPCDVTTQTYIDHIVPKTSQDQRFYLKPHGHCLAQVKEYIKLPSYLSADLWPKSSYLRCGIIPHLALIEPGWEGHLTIEIYNTNSNYVALYVGQGIVQMRFHMIENVIQKYEGYYQGITIPEVCLAQGTTL